MRSNALVAFCLLSSPVAAQDSAHPRSLPPRAEEIVTIGISPSDSLIQLQRQFILAGSDSLLIGPDLLLQRGRDYSLNYRQGLLRFDSAFVSRVASGAMGSRTVRVSYTYLPFRFPDSFAVRSVILIQDTLRRDTLRVLRPTSTFSVEDIFGTNLQKSGSLVRGFTVGTTRDLTPTSGLRMQLSGKIASDVEITAALSDENTPIQPEGTTQTLQEFDKVFVDIRSPVVAATLGDFYLDVGGSEFGRISRKLTGARGIVDVKTEPVTGSVLAAGAVTRGKFATNQFPGRDAVQGPYRLSGTNGERPIIVIAGTERVYVNGELQVRGEVNDYTIDYSTAEVTFSPRRLITSASRIVVDFEYTDRRFTRSLFAGKVESAFWSDRARLSVSYFREGDDPDKTIDFDLSDSARAILNAAGADRNKATVSGVTEVDSSGLYVRIDTVLTTGPAQFYRYAPGDPAARYTIVFSYVGTAQGEYVRQQAGVFVWKGPAGGDYLPIVFLPIPQLQQVFDLTLEARPLPTLRLAGEYAASGFDGNRLSSLPESKQNGQAFNLAGTFAPRAIRLGDLQLGDFDLSVKHRFTQESFVPIDRINDIEFGRKWGVDTSRSGDENLSEARLRYNPDTSITLTGGYGAYSKGSLISSDRFDGRVTIHGSGFPSLDYSMEQIGSRDDGIGDRSSWRRQLGDASYGFWTLVPFARYEAEERVIENIVDGSVRPGSLRFDDVSGGIRTRDLGRLFLSAGYGWRDDRSFLDGSIRPQAKSFTQNYTVRLGEWNNLGTSLEVVLRDKKYSQEFRSAGYDDIQTVLVRSQTRYTPLQRGVETDLYYEVSTQQTSRLQRVFVPVSPGTGNYRYLGDLNGNGRPDENEFEQVRFDGDYLLQTFPSDQLFPVIELNTSVRLRVTPARFLGSEHGLIASLFTPLSTDTYFRVQERSTVSDLKKIYLFHTSAFQQDSTTINGYTNFLQDVNLFEANRLFSVRLRYSERRGMSNFVTGVERAYAREQSIRLRVVPVREIANQLDYSEKLDRLVGEYSSSRFRNISASLLSYDISYRPEQKFELGLNFDVGSSTDEYPAEPLTAAINTESVRMVYAFEGSGQARVQMSREEVKLNRSGEAIPYELTGGKLPGITWLWQAALDFQFVGFLQAGATYDGRIEGGSPPIHTLSAQVRAYF